MKRLLYILLITLIPLAGFTQFYPSGYRLFQPMSVTGALKLGGHYRHLDGFSNEIYNYQKSSLIYGGILLNSNSYILHPNFLVLDLGLEYNPEKGQDLYLVVPDQSEVRTLKKVNINGTFFKNKNITLGFFANFNQMFNNRENLSNIKTNATNWGGNFSLTNKYVPLTGSYTQGKMTELEISTGRLFTTKNKNILARINKSFTSHDLNELGYSHNDYLRKDLLLPQIRNICDNIYLNDNIYFNKTKTSSLYSNISGTYQVGNESYNRVQVMENVAIQLPRNFYFNCGYDYFYHQQLSQRLNHHTIIGTIRHKLYQSLTSMLSLEYNRMTHTVYKENNGRAAIDLNYEKNIPTGHLSISYKFSWQRQNRQSESVPIRIFNEAHTLTD
ncbi:MAG: hypothetical protein WCL00_14690, partial [Bacteroidota bacterium]